MPISTKSSEHPVWNSDIKLAQSTSDGHPQDTIGPLWQDPSCHEPLKKPKPSISEVIEDLGFGRAQLLVVATGGAVLFNRGVQMCLMSVLTVPISQDFNLSKNQQGLLSTAMFAGMFVGTLASGYFGDHMGRRFPVCASSIFVVILGILSAACPNFHILFIVRIALGFAMAFGDVPVTALFSELSPNRWKIPMRAAAEALFDVGYTYTAFLATTRDPFLRDLEWRKLLVLSCIPPGILGLAAVYLLPESPIFLASVGRREKALQTLQYLRRLNRVPTVQIDYQPPAPIVAELDSTKDPKAGRGCVDPALSIVFSKQYRYTAFVLAYIAAALNIFYYGGMYAQPQVMTKGKGLAPGWEIVIGGPFDLIGISAATLLAAAAPRKLVLGFAMFMAAMSISFFGYAGSVPSRSATTEVMYQFGVFGFYWIPAVGFIVFSQLAVESFPTVACSTGGSIAFCAGRLGGMISPVLFENIWVLSGKWSTFCHFSAIVSGCAVLLLGFQACASTPRPKDPVEAEPNRSAPLLDQEAGKSK